MTEQEAVSVVRMQFASDEGFVARLRRGDGLDRSSIAQAREALDALLQAWRGLTYIPKDAVRPLIGIATVIRSCADLYPLGGDEIEDLADEMRDRIVAIFVTRRAAMSEEEAMAVVWVHLRGIESLRLRLHERGGLDSEAVSQVQTALDVLGRAWAAQEVVPRAAAGAMIDAYDAIWENAGWYPAQATELQRLAQDLDDRTKRCFA